MVVSLLTALLLALPTSLPGCLGEVRCPECEKLFISRPAAIDHLAYRAPRCRAQLPSLTPLSESTILNLDRLDRLNRGSQSWLEYRGLS